MSKNQDVFFTSKSASRYFISVSELATKEKLTYDSSPRFFISKASMSSAATLPRPLVTSSTSSNPRTQPHPLQCTAGLAEVGFPRPLLRCVGEMLLWQQKGNFSLGAASSVPIGQLKCPVCVGPPTTCFSTAQRRKGFKAPHSRVCIVHARMGLRHTPVPNVHLSY